jgi:hypothetical protein
MPLAAAALTLSLLTGCGHGGGAMAGKIAAGLAVAAAASVVNSAINEPHPSYGSYTDAEARAAVEAANRADAAAKLRAAESQYNETATPVPTF